MKLEKMPIEFQDALPIIQKLEEAGFEAYFVGGSVRDTLLGKPIHDVDIATSAFPEEVKRLFERTVDTGIEHGTVMILDHGQGYETTTFRTESTYTDFRRPDEVTFVRSLTEDLKRRDFTVNAFALKGDGEIIDLFDGLHDLEQKQLRAVGSAVERFHEDALRMMRALRFASQLNFTIVPETQQAIIDNAQLLAKIAIERVNVEFTKLMQGPAANYGLLELVATGLNHYMPGLRDTEIDLTGYATLTKKQQPKSDVVAWTLLAFELGLTAGDTGVFLRKWKHGNELINTAQQSIQLLNQLRLSSDPTDWQLYQTGASITVALKVAEISELVVNVDQLALRYEALPIKTKNDMALTGKNLMNDLNLKPGPLFGKILNMLEKQIVLGKVANTYTDLVAAATTLSEKEKK